MNLIYFKTVETVWKGTLQNIATSLKSLLRPIFGLPGMSVHYTEDASLVTAATFHHSTFPNSLHIPNQCSPLLPSPFHSNVEHISPLHQLGFSIHPHL